MARKYTISSLQQTLFGPQAFNYFKSATESRSMTGWDFDGGGDLNSFDLSVYEISLMLYEEYEERKAYVLRTLASIDNAEFNVSGTLFKLTDMDDSELINFFNSLNSKLARARKIKVVNKGKATGFTIQVSVGGKTATLPISINPKSTLNYKSLLVFNTSANKKQMGNALKKASISCAAKGINNKKINNFEDIANSISEIINSRMVGNVSANRTGVVTFADVLLLTDPDADYFPVFVDPTLREQQKNFNLYDLFVSSKAFYGLDILNYSNNKNYKENFLFKGSDLYDGQKNKVIKFASGLYEQQDIYNADPNGPIDSIGIKSYSAELPTLKNIPIPPAHASYRTEDLAGTTVSPEYKVGLDGLATEFYAAFDIAFFRNNLENILKPSIRDAAVKIVQKILDKYPPNTNPLPNFPFTTAANIDFADKVISDIVSAICDGNDEYFTTSRALGGKYGISFGGTLTLSDFRGLTATLSAGPRFYSDKEIIQRPVWKLIKCHSNEVYYVRANEFYDYSLSGLYHLSNIDNTNEPLPQNDNLFLNQRFPNGEIAGIYMLNNFSDQYIENDYTYNYFNKYPVFNNNWGSISSNVKGYLYDQATPAIPTGCYKVYLGIMPKDPNLILNYTSLPHYWKHGDCSKPPCIPPPATPTSTRTPDATTTPTSTPSLTATQTPTRTQTQTPTQTQTQTNTPTQTQTQTKTSTPTQTQTPSVTATPTQTQTPSRTPTQTPSVTASVTRTQTQTQSITASVTRTQSQTQTITPSNTQTQTPSKTQTSTPTQTKTPTTTSTQTQTQTPTQTQTETQTPSVTTTPSTTHTKFIPISQTPSPTASSTPSTTTTLTATVTPSPTASSTPSTTTTLTATPTPSPTASSTPSTTTTLTATPTPSASKSPTPTSTQTPSNTKTQTPTQTQTKTQTPTTTNTLTATPTQTQTPSETPTRTPTTTPSQTKTQTPTNTPSGTATRTQTQTQTATKTQTSTPSRTKTPTTTKTNSATPTQTSTPEASTTPSPTPEGGCQLDFVLQR